jgi:hypothetical protein
VHIQKQHAAMSVFWNIFVLSAATSRSPPPNFVVSVKPNLTKSISVGPGFRLVLFLSVAKSGVCNVTFFSGSSFSKTIVMSSEFQHFIGERIEIRAGNRAATAFIWKIPSDFCPTILYAISSAGTLVGEVTSADLGGPTCIFSVPFARKHHLVSNFKFSGDSSHVSIDYYVKGLDHPYSSCDKDIECVFWHTRPFLLRISGIDRATVSIVFRYQVDPQPHVRVPCFLGILPNLNSSLTSHPREFAFKCEDKAELRSDEFKLIFRLVFVVLALALLLHLCGCVNMCAIVGCHEDEVRFAKIRVGLRNGAGEQTVEDNPSDEVLPTTMVESEEWDSVHNPDA